MFKSLSEGPEVKENPDVRLGSQEEKCVEGEGLHCTPDKSNSADSQ